MRTVTHRLGANVATWEMGLLDRAGWKGQWIGSPTVGGPYSIPPVPYLRKRFDVNGKSIARARLYVTALGMHEFELNGQRVGRDVMAPGRTEYQKRVPYHVYDVAGTCAPARTSPARSSATAGTAATFTPTRA
jgi:alpha-L-rhamnosidase